MSESTLKQHARIDGWYESLHYCSAAHLNGLAIEACYTISYGTMYVANARSRSQVNYCPVCGKEAPVQAAPAP